MSDAEYFVLLSITRYVLFGLFKAVLRSCLPLLLTNITSNIPLRRFPTSNPFLGVLGPVFARGPQCMHAHVHVTPVRIHAKSCAYAYIHYAWVHAHA